MEKREAGRKFSRTVPVIIENHENATKKTKLMVPSNYTAGQLANILRSRMHLLPYHPVYLFLKSKQSPVLMSKSIGHLHLKHRDEKGLLRLIQAEQASFGFRGNIRAIRFRQKWIENQSPEGAQAPCYPYGIPSHFPQDPPALANPSEVLGWIDQHMDAISYDLLDFEYDSEPEEIEYGSVPMHSATGSLPNIPTFLQESSLPTNSLLEASQIWNPSGVTAQQEEILSFSEALSLSEDAFLAPFETTNDDIIQFFPDSNESDS